MRLDSYESEKHQEYVRTFLEGRFENSAFCLLTPDGEKWLSKAGRGPQMVLGRGATSRMQTVSALYPPIADVTLALVPDFHSLRQALNVASADQRVLVVIHGAEEVTQPLHETLKVVANDKRIIGRFHFDFESKAKSLKDIKGLTSETGIALIRSGEFGLSGDVIDQLPLGADPAEIVTAFLKANEQFANTTAKKSYSEHVAKGRKQGIYFEGNVPYGEDRDGDGKVDHSGSAGRSGRSQSRSRSRTPGR